MVACLLCYSCIKEVVSGHITAVASYNCFLTFKFEITVCVLCQQYPPPAGAWCMDLKDATQVSLLHAVVGGLAVVVILICFFKRCYFNHCFQINHTVESEV